MLSIDSTTHWLRPINLLAKRAGERSAGNLHAPFDVAGDGNQLAVRFVRHSQRKRGATDRSNLRSQAPFLDPTRSNKSKEGAAESVVLLCRVLPQVETHLPSRPRAFGADDLLDAAAAAWSALNIRFENVPEPKIEKPTDAIIRLAVSCVCGSDLWSYRGIQSVTEPTPMGHEYCGYVEEVGSAVTSVKPGQFVVGSFAMSDNTCPHCRLGYQSSCQQREWVTRAQAPYMRVALVDGTLVPTSDSPSDGMLPSLLAASDVLGTGWFAADAANVKEGSTAVVVGDGAVGLLGVLSAKQMGAERIIAMSRHEARQKLAREFGATDIVTERGSEGIARIKELTKGIGADSVLECVGTQEAMEQAIQCARPGGFVSYVGVPHGVQFDGQPLFFSHVHLHGGPAPVRRYLPNLINMILNGTIQPGKVFDLELPLEKVAEGYAAMDDRRAIKTLLRP